MKEKMKDKMEEKNKHLKLRCGKKKLGPGDNVIEVEHGKVLWVSERRVFFANVSGTNYNARR